MLTEEEKEDLYRKLNSGDVITVHVMAPAIIAVIAFILGFLFGVGYGG